MTELPIVTQLPSEHLHGYAAAMAEVADACLRVSDMRDWALDRAALARGIILRETALAEAPLPDDELAVANEIVGQIIARNKAQAMEEAQKHPNDPQSQPAPGMLPIAPKAAQPTAAADAIQQPRQAIAGTEERTTRVS